MQTGKVIMSVKEANKVISKEFHIARANEHGVYPIYKLDTSSHTIALGKYAHYKRELFGFAKNLEQAVDITKGIDEQDPSTIGLRKE
jgi:hypothetical protein